MTNSVTYAVVALAAPMLELIDLPHRLHKEQWIIVEKTRCVNPISHNQLTAVIW